MKLGILFATEADVSADGAFCESSCPHYRPDTACDLFPSDRVTRQCVREGSEWRYLRDKQCLRAEEMAKIAEGDTW
jgi:hypothetical protein